MTIYYSVIYYDDDDYTPKEKIVKGPTVAHVAYYLLTIGILNVQSITRL